MSLESTNTRPTVLVVEDEPDLADLYSAWLDREYPVRTALDGEEALSELGPGVDIVLLDRRMPGLSGDEVLARIRERSVECRVAMVTAVEPGTDIIEMGFDDYLVKPVTKSDLDATIDRLMRRNEYDSKLDEYLTLVRKKSTLESGKTPAELRESPEFARLQDRIEELRDDVDPMVQEFDDEDLAAVLRDVEQ
jgi:two-component system response regulator AdeR